MTGEGLPANVLKEFIDMSYLGNTSVAPAGYVIDTPLSDSRVKVYTKPGSKNVIVTHRGSVGLDDWWDNAKYATMGKVKGTKTYELHRKKHKAAIDKYGAQNIIAIGHSRAGLYLQELQKEFPIKENITYNKATGFTDIGRQNTGNQTDVRVGNDVVSLLSGTQKNPNQVIKIDNTKNPFDFNKAHQTGELERLGTQFIGLADDEATGSGILPKIVDPVELQKMLAVEQKRLAKIEKGFVYKSKTMTKEKIIEKIQRLRQRIINLKKGNVSDFVPSGDKWLKMNLYSTLTSKPRTNKQIIAVIEGLLKKVSKSKTIPPEAKTDIKEKLEAEKSHYESMKKNIEKKVKAFDVPAAERLPAPLRSDTAKQRQIKKLERDYKSTADEGVRENILSSISKINKTLPQSQRAANQGWVQEAQFQSATQMPRVRSAIETAVIRAGVPSIPRLDFPSASTQEALVEPRKRPLVLLTKPNSSITEQSVRRTLAERKAAAAAAAAASAEPPPPMEKVFKTSQAQRDKQNERRRANAEAYKEQRKAWDEARATKMSGIRALGLDPKEVVDKYNRDERRLGQLVANLEAVKDPKKRSDYLEEMSAIRRRRPQYEEQMKPIYTKYLSEIVNSGNTKQNIVIERSEPAPEPFLRPVDNTGQLVSEVEMSEKARGKLPMAAAVAEEEEDSDYEEEEEEEEDEEDEDF
jgi:hypothetical protein